MSNSNSIDDERNMQLVSGIAAFEAKEFRRAWQLLQPLSDSGLAEAQYRCAIMVQNGLGVIARPAVAAEFMLKAATQKLGLAQHGLGIMYLFGEGVEQSTPEAVRLLKLAGESGLAGAWSTLGTIYMDGQSVEKDRDLARSYFAKAGFDPGEFS